MNEDIIRMARKAGLEKYHLPDSMMEYEFDRCIERFAALVRADEREACAKLCEELPTQRNFYVRHLCAAAIRARGQPTPCPDCRGIGYDASGQLCGCQRESVNF